jgi:hypothetical protein
MIARLADWNRFISITGLLLVLFGAALVVPAAAQGRLQGEVTGGMKTPIAIPSSGTTSCAEVTNIISPT